MVSVNLETFLWFFDTHLTDWSFVCGICLVPKKMLQNEGKFSWSMQI
jgi:hypothetical protein